MQMEKHVHPVYIRRSNLSPPQRLLLVNNRERENWGRSPRALYFSLYLADARFFLRSLWRRRGK